MISVSLNGYLNYLDMENPDKPKRVIQGHASNITALLVDGDQYFAGGSDGDPAISYFYMLSSIIYRSIVSQ